MNWFLPLNRHLRFIHVLCDLRFHFLHMWVSAQSYLTLCDSMDCSLPGSSAHRSFQARILGWVATSSSRRSSQPREQRYSSCISRVSSLVGGFFTNGATWFTSYEWIIIHCVEPEYVGVCGVIISLHYKGTLFLSRLLTGLEMETWSNTSQRKLLSSQTPGLFPVMLTFKFPWKPGNTVNFLLCIFIWPPLFPLRRFLSLHSLLSTKQLLEM